jgi:hypothetical protein
MMKRRALLLLTTLTIGCDVPPGADGIPRADDPRSPEEVSSETNPLAHQLPGRDLSQDPPRVASLRLVPLATDGSGDARLEVTFREKLPASLSFLRDGEVVVLRDDGTKGDQVSGDGIYSALTKGEAGLLPTPSQTAGAATTVLAAPVSASDLDPEKMLLIRNLAVVNHYFRATDPCKPPKAATGQTAAPPEDQKKWGFAYLMGQMANQASTNISPSSFALQWLDEWLKLQTVNGDKLKPVDGNANGMPIAKYLRTTWLKASGNTGKLDMKKAPFRLLAIVNRFDLRQNQAFNSGNAGELRFVFGALDLAARETPNGVCSSLAQTPGPGSGAFQSDSNVILEYAVDLKDATAVKAYAQKWVDLNKLDINSSAYRVALEAITESVVKANVGKIKNRRNGSALNALRTNESNDDNTWDLREFAIDPSSANTHLLKAQTVANTPSEAVNGSDDLSFWASFWAEEIMDDKHKVPLTFQGDPSAKTHKYTHTKFRGSHALNNSGHLVWDFPAADDVRFHLALNTCNGCHSDESLQTGLAFHVRGRPWNEMAELSPFLIGDGQGGPFMSIDRVSGTVRPFFDLDRRRNDLADFLSGSSLAALSFRPLARTH